QWASLAQRRTRLLTRAARRFSLTVDHPRTRRVRGRSEARRAPSRQAGLSPAGLWTFIPLSADARSSEGAPLMRTIGSSGCSSKLRASFGMEKGVDMFAFSIRRYESLTASVLR